MFGIIGGIVNGVLNTVEHVSVGAIALTLGATKKAVQIAIDAGCKTEEEIREFLDLD